MTNRRDDYQLMVESPCQCVQSKALDSSNLSMISLHTPAVCSVMYMADLQSQLKARPGSCVTAPAAFDREIDDQTVAFAPPTMRESLA
ncbi:MAG: hypothetical protein ACI83N_002313 [Hydrogenophaga sp.]|jgi:hypothetical protein